MTTQQMLPAVEQHARATVSELFQFIALQGGRDYTGEKVSQLEHSLQAAQLAQQAGADDETILGALFHDVGRFLPFAEGEMPRMIAPNNRTCVGCMGQELLGEKYLRQLGFSKKICQLVGAHVTAKRYLTAVEEGYSDGLSESSKATLEFQGGKFDASEVKAAQADPLLEAKLAVRRWDDQAKVPNIQTPPLSEYEEMAVRSLLGSRSPVLLHGRTYNLPKTPTVVVCVDGFDPEYLERGVADGIVPHMETFVRNGFHTTAKCAMPSFTNPNNVSIITGAPTSVHGISGNFFLDQETKQESMITDDKLLKGSTILEQMSKRGVRIAAITAKDKLRRIIQHGLGRGSICFSSECAKDCTTAENGITGVEEWIGRPAPPQYSGDISIFVLDAGVRLLQEDRADLLYLTLSDYIQHKYAPGAKESNEFLAALDKRLGMMVDLGATVAVTADHGMNDKAKHDGSPNVLFLEEALERKWGKGFARVICPITDPFVRHHGALGSFVRLYRNDKSVDNDRILEFCRSLPEVELALTGDEAAARFEMPLDREGDFVIVAKKNAVIGSRKEEHDMSSVMDHRLRSHGGLSEQSVPLLKSTPTKRASAAAVKCWRNFDVFDLALNE